MLLSSFKRTMFDHDPTRDYPRQPRSGVRMHPTAQGVGEKWETAELQRSDRPVRAKPRAGLFKMALLGFTVLSSMALLQAQSPDLPPGPAQAKVRTACLECHDASIIVQQRLSKASWTKEVDKMIKWGALVEPADRDSFIDYLSTNFPPDKTPSEMPRTASTKKH
jgi:hypothetical protein